LAERRPACRVISKLGADERRGNRFLRAKQAGTR
jgi:hypothetical protein